jgi:hypothetical protein
VPEREELKRGAKAFALGAILGLFVALILGKRSDRPPGS